MDCCRGRTSPMAYLRLDACLAGKICTGARRSESIADRCRSCADDHSHYFRTDSLDALPNNSRGSRRGPALVVDRVPGVPRKRRSYFPAALVQWLSSGLLCTARRYRRHAHGAVRNRCRRRALAGRAAGSTAGLCRQHFRHGRLDLCDQYGRDEYPYVHHGRGLANRYVSAGHGSNLWSSACFCSSLSFHLAVTARWQGGAQRTICTAEVLSHARRLRVISGHLHCNRDVRFTPKSGLACDYSLISSTRSKIAAPRRQRSITSKSTGGSAVSTPFSLPAELKVVEVAPGVTLGYWGAGGGQVLVMLPGLGHAASLYKYQLEGLCDEFRVIALDPRGHGESDKPERGYNYHTLAKDLDGFLRALDLNDATILGHSGGCKIILTYLELYGDSRLRAIVFSDDSPCHLRDG